MVSRKNIIDVVVAIIILFVYLMGFTCGNSSKKCPKPVAIAQAIDTVKVNVPGDTVRDTLYKVKWYSRAVHDTEWLASGAPAEIQVDTQRCFDFSTTTPDSVTINGTACSRDFPVRKPLDLTVDIQKITPQRTVKEIITISDTAFYEKKHPWKHVKIFGVACGVGIAAGAV